MGNWVACDVHTLDHKGTRVHIIAAEMLEPSYDQGPRVGYVLVERDLGKDVKELDVINYNERILGKQPR